MNESARTYRHTPPADGSLRPLLFTGREFDLQDALWIRRSLPKLRARLGLAQGATHPLQFPAVELPALLNSAGPRVDARGFLQVALEH